ncbi:MAG: M48 family metallopeptidase [Chlorobiaceae bacterium]|nr:M48 family metallopeptidase [Chlorobiaceae bacterium]NTW73534.1 M48 family metallopeptidase [Chlorobiaceae bacterium]
MSIPIPGPERAVGDLAYTVRVSRRARYARLRISPHEGLTVVVPQGFDQRQVPGLVESRRGWVEKVLGSFDQRRLTGVSDTGRELPTRIELSGIGESWTVTYRSLETKGVAARELAGEELLLSGPVDDAGLCRLALESWLRRRAAMRLVPQLERLATTYGFTYGSVSLRKQRSRWGSCSTRGTLSLNLKLLFLPPLLVRYIMIHELCHTRHMNHSRRFWAEVAKFDPDHASHDRQMRHAWRFVPGWFAVRE